jgi:hypothetical protein
MIHAADEAPTIWRFIHDKRAAQLPPFKLRADCCA